MKLPRRRPITSKCAAFSWPPVEARRTEFPPASSAISGARFFASRRIFAEVPATLTVSLRRSPGASDEELACSSRARNVIDKLGKVFFPQAISTRAAPGPSSLGGRITSDVGEAARTSAVCPPIVTVLASASPQKPWPRMSKRSLSDATRGADVTLAVEASAEGGITVVGTRPARPAIEPKIMPGFKGATNRARPD